LTSAAYHLPYTSYRVTSVKQEESDREEKGKMGKVGLPLVGFTRHLERVPSSPLASHPSSPHTLTDPPSFFASARSRSPGLIMPLETVGPTKFALWLAGYRGRVAGGPKLKLN
jgi:hypothetical protein